MTIDVLLPELAENLTDAKLAVWLKREGDAVTAGEPIAEIETEKTNVELESPATGVLVKIVVPEGTDGLAPGGLLAVVDEGATATTATPPESPGSSDPGVHDGGSSEAAPADPVIPEVVSPAPIAPGARNATPLAGRMAAVAGLDISGIQGSGSGGRILKSDIDRLLAPETVSDHVDRPLTAMKRVTASRMTDAKRTVPHFYLRTECDAGAFVAERARLNGEGAGITLTDLMVRAAALALAAKRDVNASWVENAIRLHHNIDIAVAVATPGGLITPIVRKADTKTLAEISHALKDLSTRARMGALTPDEYSGGTFTISNLGMYGVESLYAIVNPPQSAILGVGAVTEQPVVREGSVAVGARMTCTLSADHRTLDGATGAEFLQEIKRLVETPAVLGQP
jgi:pyruvate dehydrogenase E2 component (dihydrolipoamide acetyltransferase)